MTSPGIEVERFVVNRASLRAALLAVAPFTASSAKEEPELLRMCAIAYREHLVVTATDRYSWAAAALRLQSTVLGDGVHVPASAPELRAWSLDSASAKAITQVIRPPSDKDARSMWESLDALLTFDDGRVHVEEVGDFAGGREVAVEITVETGDVAAAAPARAVPAMVVPILELAPDDADERRVDGDRLVKMRTAASAVGTLIRYSHRGSWLVGTCSDSFVMGVYAPESAPPHFGGDAPVPEDRLDRWHHDMRDLTRAIESTTTGPKLALVPDEEVPQ